LPGTGADEVTLDIELMTAMAPGASKIIVYAGSNSAAGVLETYNRIATDNLAKQITTSWGISESSIPLLCQSGEHQRDLESIEQSLGTGRPVNHEWPHCDTRHDQRADHVDDDSCFFDQGQLRNQPHRPQQERIEHHARDRTHCVPEQLDEGDNLLLYGILNHGIHHGNFSRHVLQDPVAEIGSGR
jgi:hypothetical protein